MDLSKIQIKSYKSFRTPDGYAYSANIYFEGKKIGSVMHHGDGGEPIFNFINNKIEQELKTAVDKWAAKHPENYRVGDYQVSHKPGELDIWIETLLDNMENQKWFKRNCKKKTLFRLEGDEKGTWRIIAHPFDERVATHIRKKYGNNVEEIANETRI